MDKVQKQRGSIVLYKEERNGADYIRIEYVNSQAVALLLAQDTDVEKTGNSSATYLPPLLNCRISMTAIRPTPILITAGFTCGIPNLKGNTYCREATSNCWNRSVQPFHHKSL